MNLNKYDLVIKLDYSAEDYNIAASEDMPLPVQGEWEAFLINIENILEENGFVIVEQHESNRPNSISQYYGVYPADYDGNVLYKVLIILRVSDHKLPKGSYYGRHYYTNYANRLKYPKDKKSQPWKLIQVVVQSHSTDNYWTALDYVENVVQQWKQVK